MSDTTEAQLRLELAATQFHLAAAQLRINNLNKQHLEFAHAVQTTLYHLTTTSAIQPPAACQEMLHTLAELTELNLAQIRQEIRFPDPSPADPYDLRALPAITDTSGAGEPE